MSFLPNTLLNEPIHSSGGLSNILAVTLTVVILSPDSIRISKEISVFLAVENRRSLIEHSPESTFLNIIHNQAPFPSHIDVNYILLNNITKQEEIICKRKYFLKYSECP